MPDDFNTPDEMAVEEVRTFTRNKALPRELAINADTGTIFARWVKGRIHNGDFVDQTRHTETLRDTVDEEGNPDDTSFTDAMNSTAHSVWVRAQAHPPTFREVLRHAMYLIGKSKGLVS